MIVWKKKYSPLFLGHVHRTCRNLITKNRMEGERASPRERKLLATVDFSTKENENFFIEWGLGEFNASTSLFSSVEQTPCSRSCSTCTNCSTITHVRARRLTPRNRKQSDLGRNQTQGPIIQRLVRSLCDPASLQDGCQEFVSLPDRVPLWLCSNLFGLFFFFLSFFFFFFSYRIVRDRVSVGFRSM